jgi:ATP phosphoribosyltransferase
LPTTEKCSVQNNADTNKSTVSLGELFSGRNMSATMKKLVEVGFHHVVPSPIEAMA